MKKLSKYDELIELFRDNSYPDFITELNRAIKDPKLKFLLEESYGGLLSDDLLQYKVVDIPVKKLIPTQNEIDLDKSLLYPLSAKTGLDVYFKPSVIIIAPILTFNEQFIIDGHHRWSQVYCINRLAKMKCVNFNGDFSPVSMLKIVQAAIAGNLGQVPVQLVEGTSMFDVSDDKLLNYITDNISDKAVTEMLKLVKELDSKEDVITHIRNNCKELIINNTPVNNAPNRGLMPQTDQSPESVEDLKTGIKKLSKRSFSIKSFSEEIIVADDKTIKDIVQKEIRRLGNNADLNHIDVSKVTNMSYMFENSNFNGDISKWNVSNVTDMSYMFYGSKFNGDISNWDVSNVKSMITVFNKSPLHGQPEKQPNFNY